MGRLSWITWGAQGRHKGPLRKVRVTAVGVREDVTTKAEAATYLFGDAVMLALEMEEGAVTQGMQAPSEIGKSKCEELACVLISAECTPYGSNPRTSECDLVWK